VRPLPADRHHVSSRPDLKCDVTTSGTLPAGQEKDQRFPTQVLYFRPSDATHLQYWGTGWFAQPELTCGNLASDGGDLPSGYFEFTKEANGTVPVAADGGTCNNKIWQLETTADTISGTCWSFNYPRSKQQFEWHLTRIGPAPGS
jgi:hypothetical protein